MAGISSKAGVMLANNKKYNGYEFNSDFDINLYESFYRSHDPQLGRFWQLDPKPNPFESLYASMGNNPIKNFDVLGDTLVNENDKVIVAKITDDVTKKLKTLGELSSDYVNQLDNKELSNDERDKLLDKKMELDKTMATLKESLEEIKGLIDDKKHGYTFKALDNFDTEGSLYFKGNGVVQIEYLPGTGNALHEIDHAAGVMRGIVKVYPHRLLPTSNFKLNGVSRLQFEVSGYKHQYSYDASSLPDSDMPRPKNYDQITQEYVKYIRDTHGKYIYQD